MSARPRNCFVDPATMPAIFAASAIGRCMEPLIEDDTLLVFDKRAEFAPGDIVAIHFAPHAVPPGCPFVQVKRLVLGVSPEHLGKSLGDLCPVIVVEQLNPPRQFSYRAADVLAVHRCLGSASPGPNGLAAWRPSEADTFLRRPDAREVPHV